MDEDPIGQNFEAFLDGLSPILTMAQKAVSPPTPYVTPLYTNEELFDILAPSPSPVPFQMSQHKLYKKVQSPRRNDSEQDGYSAREMVLNIKESLKCVRSRPVDNLNNVVERLKINQREEKETKIVKICDYPMRPERRKSVENSRKSVDEEKKIKKKPRKRRTRKVAATVDEIREVKRLKNERKIKLKELAAKNNNKLATNQNSNKYSENIIITETRNTKNTINKEKTQKKTTQQCQSHIIIKEKATLEKKIDKLKHRRPSEDKYPKKIDDRKRKSINDDEKGASKRRKSHEIDEMSPAAKTKPVTEDMFIRPLEITIKEEIVDLTEESSSMCVNLNFATVNEISLEICEQLPVVREQSVVKQEVEDYLFKATATVATIGTQTTEFASAYLSTTNFAKIVAGFVRDFSFLNRTSRRMKQQLIEELEGTVRAEMVSEELSEFSRHFKRRFSKIGDKMCEKLAKVEVVNFNFQSVLDCVSSHLAQATPSILLTEHQIWQHLATMLELCCTEAPTKTFVQFFREALKPPDVFETPEIQLYKNEVGWGENTLFSFDNDNTHEVPRLKLSIRTMPFQSPNQCHFFQGGEVIDLT